MGFIMIVDLANYYVRNFGCGNMSVVMVMRLVLIFGNAPFQVLLEKVAESKEGPRTTSCYQ